MVVEITVDLQDMAYEATGYDVADFINIVGSRLGISQLIDDAVFNLDTNGIDFLRRIIKKYDN